MFILLNVCSNIELCHVIVWRKTYISVEISQQEEFSGKKMDCKWIVNSQWQRQEWEVPSAVYGSIAGFYFFHVGATHKVDKQARSSFLSPLLLSHSLLQHLSPTHSTHIQSFSLTSYLVILSYSVLLSRPPFQNTYPSPTHSSFTPYLLSHSPSLHTYSIIPSYYT